jgi:hypothetical protein
LSSASKSGPAGPRGASVQNAIDGLLDFRVFLGGRRLGLGGVAADALAERFQHRLDLGLVEFAVAVLVEAVEGVGEPGWELIFLQNAVAVFVEAFDEILGAQVEKGGGLAGVLFLLFILVGSARSLAQGQ